MNADTAWIAGVDEAGRGPLAGPLVVAAVILDPACPIPGITDSKALSGKRRERLFPLIQQHARAFHIHVVGVAQIDEINIFQATMQGMRDALAGLAIVPMLARIDGNRVPPDLVCEAEAWVGGDARDAAIGAASILAKVTRDRLMCALDREYPQYGFARHKGYGTREHLANLQKYGPCAEHRRSFAPVRVAVERDLFTTGAQD